MKIKTKQIVLTALLLAICIVSQLFKNLSVFITGPIINAALILCAVYCGCLSGIILSIITPVTAFFITGSPVMSAVPLMFPCIMLGNIVLVLAVVLFKDRIKKFFEFPLSVIVGSVVKGLVMGLLISVIILPAFLPEPMMKMLPVLKVQFSTTQLFTALIGSFFAYVIKLAVDKTGLMK